MSAAFNTFAKERSAQAFSMAQDHVASFGTTAMQALEAWAWARANRRRRVMTLRANGLDAHLRHDLGLVQGVALEVAPAPTPAGVPTVATFDDPMDRCTLPAQQWPVTGANDNVSWTPGRSYLALARCPPRSA
tara:strand:- start:804 stop:1202 length:399 start_codon:yes stop_codon:yes gene_type:complete